MTGEFEIARSWRGRFGLAAAPVTFLILLSVPPPGGLDLTAWRTAACAAAMAILWITEAIPILYCTGRITVPQLVRAGALLDLLFLLLVSAAATLLVPLVFGR